MLKISSDTYPALRLLPLGCWLCLLLALAIPVQAGDPLGFTGNWTYRETGGDIESTSQFSHSYTLNYNKQLSQFMTLSGSLRYNENLPSEGVDTDSINPSIALDTRNDLFFLGLSASQNRVNREGSPSTTDNSWGGTFFTLKEDWPALRAFFNQGHNYDDGSPRQVDTESIDFGGSIEHEWSDFAMLYDFRSATTDDQLDGSSTENIEHLAQLEYSRSFFAETLTVFASQQYRDNETVTETPNTGGGDFLLPVSISFAFSGGDDTPANGTLAGNGALNDNDEITSAGIDIVGSQLSQNIAVQVDFQPVDRLQILLDRELSLALQGLLSWRVYTSDDGNSWTQVANIPATYRLDNFRTVVVLDLLNTANSRFVKAVSDISIVSVDPVFVTEIEAGEISTSAAPRVSIRRTSISHQSEIGLTYRPNERWQVSYNFRRVDNEQNRGPDSEQLNQSISASYFPTERLSFTLSLSDSIDKIEDAEDRNTRSYAASMNTALLRTLDFSLGYTRTESDDGAARQTTSDSVNAIFNAIIYPDLTASLLNSWSRTENQSGGETTTMGVTLNTNARLSPKLDVNLNASYVENSTDGPVDEADISDASTRYGVSVNYRPSDVLQLGGSFNRDEETNQNTLAGNATLLASRKLQAIFGLAYEFGDEESEQYNSTLSWLITRHLSWQTTGSFISSEGGDSWALSSTVNANY